MNPLWGFVVFLFFIFLICVVVVIVGFRQLSRKRLIENLATSKIRSIAMGLVELKGKAVSAKETLVAPFSGKKCFRHSWVVEQEYHDKDGHTHWRTVQSGAEAVPFYLQDDTGKVLVSADKAQLDMPSTFQEGSGIGKEPPARVKAFLDKKGIKWSGWIFNKPMRYRESAVEAGTALYVLGDATTNDDASLSANHTERIIVKKGRANLFFISTKEEKQITKWLGIGGWIAIILGIIFGFGSLMAMFVMTIGLIL